jgi:hypothetical protein
MKIRTGFVSNSSSASFTIMRDDLTDEQIGALEKATVDRKTLCEGFDIGYLDGVDDAWDILFTEDRVSGVTICCNGCIWEFFDKLGIPRKIVSFVDDNDWEDADED